MKFYRLSGAKFFLIVFIPYINLLNLSWMIKCLFLGNMEPLIQYINLLNLSWIIKCLFITKKHAYSNTLKISIPKTESFQSDKISDFFCHISAENIDCGYSLEPPHGGGSIEYHNLCF